MRTTAFKTHTQLKQIKQPSVNVEIIHSNQYDQFSILAKCTLSSQFKQVLHYC